MSNSEKKVMCSFRILESKLDKIRGLASKQKLSKRAKTPNVSKEINELLDKGLRDSGVDL